MKPERARELYSEYAERTLSPALRLAMDQHFSADPAALAEYKEFEQFYTVLETYEPETVEVPHGFRAKIMELAAGEQTRRESAQSNRLSRILTEWFGAAGSRRLTGGVFALVAACLVLGVFLSPHPKSGPNPGAIISSPLDLGPSAIPTTITGVTEASVANGNQYNFLIHLPTDVPNATMSASLLTDNEQITDADQRASHATPALTAPLALSNNESMDIPVTLVHPTTSGSTLNMLVQWTQPGQQASNAQVVFTPVQPGVPASTPKALPNAADFYDSLQAIAGDYGVTVIADASNAPTQSVTPPTGATPLLALQSVASQVGASVVTLSPNTYQVALPKSS